MRRGNPARCNYKRTESSLGSRTALRVKRFLVLSTPHQLITLTYNLETHLLLQVFPPRLLPSLVGASNTQDSFGRQAYRALNEVPSYSTICQIHRLRDRPIS